MRRMMGSSAATMTVAMVLTAGAWSAPALAQSQQLEGRVDRLEREMHAVQRKVFPGGGDQLLTPEITAPPAQPGVAPGTPASSPVIDLDQRVTALEQQITSMTGQLETTGHRVQELEDAFAAYRRTTDARLRTLEGSAPPAAGAGGGSFGSADAPPPIAPSRGPASRPAPAPVPAASTDSGRARQVAAVERPSTGDAEEDGYLYGYRLWAAKLYPEAEAQLKSVADKYPNTRRYSYAQNLLGRAYLDDGKPSLASIAFYDNYKKMPQGERAPDSLNFLAQALMQLKKPADACKVYGELSDVYGDKIDAAMKADVARGRLAAKCP